MGAAAFIATFVAGQLICSLLLDHVGFMNLPQQSLTAGRLLGGLFVFAGVLRVKYCSDEAEALKTYPTLQLWPRA
ncbi:MAG: DMT family transporter [Planctomycetota bacterium]